MCVVFDEYWNIGGLGHRICYWWGAYKIVFILFYFYLNIVNLFKFIFSNKLRVRKRLKKSAKHMHKLTAPLTNNYAFRENQEYIISKMKNICTILKIEFKKIYIVK